MPALRPIVALAVLQLVAGSLPAQSPRVFVAAGLSGRHVIPRGADPGQLDFDGVSARIGVEWIGKRFGWTASLGGDFAGARTESRDAPGLAGGSALRAVPNGHDVVVPGAIYRANAGLLIASDDQRRIVMTIGPAVFSGRTRGNDVAWGGVGELVIHPFTSAPNASRVGLGVEAALLSSPLGRGVDWLMTPTVRITM